MIIGLMVTGNKNISINLYIYSYISCGTIGWPLKDFLSIKLYMKNVHMKSGMEIQIQGEKKEWYKIFDV